MSSLSSQRWPTMVLLGGPPVVVKGKMGSAQHGDASRLDSRAWEVVNR
jgi:hypothetical protein